MCTATDDAGNSNTCSFAVVVGLTIACPANIITSSTAVTWPDPMVSNNDQTITVSCSPASATTFAIGQTTVTCTATSDDGSSDMCTFTVTVDQENPSITCPASIGPSSTGQVTWATPTATDTVDAAVATSCSPMSGFTFQEGSSTVTCTAIDDAGNTDTCQFMVTIDKTAPMITCPADQTTSSNVVSWTVDATDTIDQSPGVSCSLVSPATLDIGVTTDVTCTATDSAGNANSCMFSVTVDQGNPVVSCPQSITVSVTEVSYNVPGGTDDIDMEVVVSCSPMSGTTFTSNQETTVTCTGTDDAGNTGTCTFSVTVDQTNPTVTCPADMIDSQSVVMYTTPTATDNIDGAPQVTCDPASGNTFQNGQNTVTCTAVDEAGNMDTCTFKVTVDQTAPQITCPNDIKQTTAQATYTPTVTDNVDMAVDTSCTPSSGHTFPVDEISSVTCTATDDADNSAMCTFTVTVDQQNPSLSCPNNVIFMTNQATWSVTATDNLDDMVAISCDHTSGGTFPVGDTTVVCTATDDAENSVTCPITVTIDQTAPAITCPNDIIVATTTVTYTTPGATDNVDGAISVQSVSCSPMSGSTFDVDETTTATCTVSDTAGNTGSCTFTVSVDTQAPTMTCPDNICVSTTEVFWANPMATDNFDTAIDMSCSPMSGHTFTVSVPTTVTCTGTDDVGNSNTCTFTVTVDQGNPTITCPGDITTSSTQVTLSDPTVTDVFDTAPQILCSPTSDFTFPIGASTPVTCTATDKAENSASCTFSVTVDQTNPTITCPAAVVTSSSQVSYDSATASDNIDPAPQVTCSPSSGSTFVENQDTSVTCTAVDDAGNSVTCMFTVTVDQQNPTITCPMDIATSTAVVTYNPTATDTNDEAPTTTCTPASGFTFTVGSTPVTCTATDAVGNTNMCTFAVVVDQQAPSITCPSNIISSSSVVMYSNPSVSDLLDAAPQVTCSPASATSFADGTSTVTCTATDNAGNSNQCSFSVIVDRTAPTFTCPANIIMSTTQVSWTDPEASDNRDPAPSVSCNPASESMFTSGQTTVICTAMDDAGNSATCTFIVTVDQVAPSITCPTNMIVSTSVVSYTTPASTDNIDAAPQVSCSPASDTTFSSGVTTVTCTATDDAANSNTCSFTVTVDQQNPTITCPADMTVSTNVVSWTISGTSDNITPDPAVVCTPASESSFNEGLTTVTCTATDEAENSASCMFDVTVDQTNPTITCPADVVVSTTTATWSAATANDNIDDAVQITCTHTSGSTFTVGQTPVTCTATDDANNMATCMFTVTVDQVAPTVTCPADIVISSSMASWAVTTNDNYDPSPQVTCNPSSGSTFTAGVTTVTCTATDDADNSNTCSFTVTRGGCGTIPATATKCTQLLTDVYTDYDMTLFPNSVADTSSADAEARFDSLTFTDCHANAELFFCAQLFPDCPDKGWTRHPCRQLCQVVRTACETQYNAAFPASPWAWDCNDFHDTGASNELCLNPEGDFLNTGICGTQVLQQATANNRIVNGVDADECEWSSMGSLRDENNGHRCGATLLNENWAITAAHCIGPTRKLVFGDTIRNEPTQYHVEVEFSAIITHPDYDDDLTRNDVALLKFKEPITFNDCVRPMCLSTLTAETDHYTGCYNVGWGRLEYNGASPQHLQEVAVPLWTYDECSAEWGSTITMDNICAGIAPADTTGVGTCQGDSGGPLICRGADDNRWHLLGVTSFGPSGHCAQSLPSVFARVTAFYDWIDGQINGPNAINAVDCDTDTYKCSSYSGEICILQSSVCDLAVYECPRHEDELNCHSSCGTTSYTIASGGNIVFKSPNYDDANPNYPSMMFCQWEFTAPADMVILVEFNTFDLQNEDDYVYVGTTTGVSPLARTFAYTGNTVPSTWVSSGNVVAISMDTDDGNDVNYRGFQVTLTAVNPGDYTNPAYLDTTVCGARPSVLPQISGGSQVTAGWPWMGSIRTSSNAHVCGTTLIDNQWAITGRSCFSQASYVVFGDHTTLPSSTVSTHVESNICGVFINPDRPIALVKLCTAVTFNSQVAPACLHTAPTETEDYAMMAGDATSKCRILGWGKTLAADANYVDTLREAEVNLASDNCGYSTNYLCVRDTATSTAGTCSGDYGGPLVCVGDDNKWRAVGLTINSYCEAEDALHPFIRISNFLTFIEDSMAVDADCANLGAMCYDGRCYLTTGRCNGYIECSTNEDEANCDASCKVVGDTPDQQITLADQTGQMITISSANYPSDYSANIECVWFFTSPGGTNIVITLLDFSLETNYDFVRIGSGTDPRSNQVEEFTGTVTTPAAHTITSTQAWMSFSSDSSVVDSGFQIQVSYTYIQQPWYCFGFELVINAYMVYASSVRQLHLFGESNLNMTSKNPSQNGDHPIHMHEISAHKNPQYKNGSVSTTRPARTPPPPPPQSGSFLSRKQCIYICVFVILGIILIVFALAIYGLYRAGALNNLLGIKDPDLKYPTLDCPSNIVYPIKTVSWKEPTPFDFPTSPMISCTPRSGSTFSAGAITVVKCAADDSEGNTATCRFTVSIDQSTPAIICPPDIVIRSSTATWQDPMPYFFLTSPDITCLPSSGTKFSAGKTSNVVCLADDNKGNSAVCSFTVTIDQQGPVIMCPLDVTASSNPVTWDDPVTLDDIDTALTLSCDQTSGSDFPDETPTEVTCTVIDDAGNLASCSFVVTVDPVPPTIVCPANFDVSSNPVVWHDDVKVSDNLDTSVFYVCDPESGASFPDGQNTVTCTATDNAGNMASCNFKVTLNSDQQRPSITCPPDITRSTDIISWEKPIVSDNIDTSLHVVCDPPTDSTFELGQTTVTCTATDDAGLSASCEFKVFVDPVLPTIVCPANFDVSSNPVVWHDDVQVSDNLDTSIFYVCDPESGASFPDGQNTVTCTATDNAGNMASCNFKVTLISDQQRPSITCPPDITRSTDIISWEKPIVSDNIDTSLHVVCDPPTDSIFELGQTTVTCTATDDAGLSASCEFRVFVDQQAPQISCPADVISSTTQVFWNNPIASDNSNKEPTVACVPSSGAMFPTDTSTPVICTAVDATDNSASCMFNVIVDQTAPPITCPGDIVTSSSQVFWPDPLVFDNIDTNPTVECNPSSGATFSIGQKTVVTCTTIDFAGFSNTCTFSVTVDQVPPVIICPARMMASTNQVFWTDPIASDLIDLQPTVACTPVSGSSFNEGLNTVICTATDATGNVGLCSFDIIIGQQDQINPSITCPGDFATSTDIPSWPDPVVSDNLDTSLTASCSPPSDSRFRAGQTTVTCTTTDNAGNTATCRFDVVVDQEKPLITCPFDEIISSDQLFWLEPLVFDNLDIFPQVTCTPSSGSTFTSGVTTVTCTATDDAGNFNTCSFTVTRGGCGNIPTTASKCIQLLTTAYTDYDMTLFPNSIGDMNAADAVTRFNSLTFTSCNANAELFFCAQLFPDCPDKGWTRKPCRQLCQAVRTDCEGTYNAAFPSSPWAWDCNEFHDTGGSDELCLLPEGDFLNTGICGTQVVSPGAARIVNGLDADEGEWPFIGSLRDLSNDHRCGATVLNEQWAITAAHCIGSSRTLVLGDTIKDQPTQYHVDVEFSAIITHPQYDSDTYFNDLALLRFKQPITFNDYVRPICLATLQEELQHYTGCYAIGWGRLTYKGESPEHLQEVDVPLWTHDDCVEEWGSSVNTDNICAGVAPEDTLGKGTCQGDSGGPMICRGADDSRWHLVGVTSFGPSGNCAQRSPNVCVRITQFYDWIDEQINGANAINAVDCNTDTFKCSSYSGDICILQSSVCDLTVYACPSHEDELNCHDSCGDTSYTLTTGRNIVFKSPNYDDLFPDYPSLMFCQWEFTAPADKVILVEFNTFDLQDGDDFVYIGTTTGVGPLTRTFSHTGNAVPSLWVSEGNTVTISMDNDKSNDDEYRGFQVTLTAVSPDDFQNPAYLDTSVCGARPSILPQISGGTEATAGWPWMGSIRLSSGVHHCGITLLDSEWAITMRTCINDGRYAVFGDHTTTKPPTVGTHVESTFCGIFTHPKYFIALIKLCTPVTFNSQVAPACLHTSQSEIQDYAMNEGDVTSKCRILGWGQTSSAGENVETLRDVEVNLATDNCGFSDNYLCVRDTATSTAGACSGDKGGPLLCIGDDQKWRVVAVILNTYCEEEGAEHPFIRLSPFQTFLSDSMAVDNDCANLGATCNDGRCYLTSGRCNGYYECEGKEDEVNCHDSCIVVGDTPDQQITLAEQPNQSITISSANYPNTYDNGIECVWIFTSPGESSITFTLQNFATETTYDYVRIGSGMDYTTQQVQHLTGTLTTPVTYTINSNQAWMSFTTDGSDGESGFQIQVSYD
ncbi:uncharacterized protein [Amphiura filiformis]|uniref:uncharacterized protein n=1 Tax=Amphiura filiformis TaxID=82378 RepID=UPI003B20ED46